MNKVQKNIIKLILPDLIKTYPSIAEYNEFEIAKTIFKNYRTNTGNMNLNLTTIGYLTLKEKIKFYDFRLEEKPFTSKHLIWLDRTQQKPYYYNMVAHIFFTSCDNLAFHLKLSDTHFNLDH